MKKAKNLEGCMKQNILITSPILKSVRYIVSDLFVEVFHTTFVWIIRHVVHQYDGR